MPLDRRPRPVDGLLHRAQRLIQPQHRHGAEPGSDLRARNAQQVPHRPQAKPAQPGHRAGIEPQAGDRQIGQRRLFLPRRQMVRSAPAVRQCPGGPGGAGNRQRGRGWHSAPAAQQESRANSASVANTAVQPVISSHSPSGGSGAAIGV